MWQAKHRIWTSYLLVLSIMLLFWAVWRSLGQDDAPNVVDRETTLDGTVFVGVLNMKGSGRLGTIVEVDRQSREVWKYVLPESINPPETGLLDVEPTHNDTVLFCVRGSGFYEVNRDKEIVWSLPDPRASHDIDLLDNGNLLVTYTWAKRGEVLAAEIKRDGTPVWTFDGLSLFSTSKFRDFKDELGAWAHVNSVERLSNGHTMVTVRNFNAIVELDAQGEVFDTFWLDARKTKYSLGSQGLLRGARPHGSTRQPNEDRLTTITRNPNRVVEYDLKENRVLRTWWGNQLGSKYSKARYVIPLPHGHWLLTSPNFLFEINAKDEVVWMYAPDLHQEAASTAAPFFKSVFRSIDGTFYGR